MRVCVSEVGRESTHTHTHAHLLILVFPANLGFCVCVCACVCVCVPNSEHSKEPWDVDRLPQTIVPHVSP